MSTFKLNTITDRCILTGRTFAHEAEGMALAGKIPKNDPRYVFRNRSHLKPVPCDIPEIRKQWDAFLEQGPIPTPATASILLAQSILRRNETRSVQRDLATCLESAALHIYKSNPTDTAVPEYVGMASKLCDGIVLGLRHADEKKSVAQISETELIPPQRVLAGMMRVGLVDQNDFRVSAFLQGEIGEVNAMSRSEYFDHAKMVISRGVKASSRAEGHEDEKKEIGAALYALKRSSEITSDSMRKEIVALNANSRLAENLGFCLPENDTLLKQQLAGVSMSSSARAIALVEEASLKKTLQNNIKPKDVSR